MTGYQLLEALKALTPTELDYEVTHSMDEEDIYCPVMLVGVSYRPMFSDETGFTFQRQIILD